MNIAPAYFRRKIEEKYNQKKSPAVWFPTYLLYFILANLVTALKVDHLLVNNNKGEDVTV